MLKPTDKTQTICTAQFSVAVALLRKIMGTCNYCGSLVAPSASACPKCGNTDFSVQVNTEYIPCSACKATGFEEYTDDPLTGADYILAKEKRQPVRTPTYRKRACHVCNGSKTIAKHIYRDARR